MENSLTMDSVSIQFHNVDNISKEGEEKVDFDWEGMHKWTGDDFPKRQQKDPKMVNKFLALYTRLRHKIFSGDENDILPDKNEKVSVCCDGIAGIFGLIFLLLIDIAYVTYATVCNQLKTEDDIRLMWLSVIVWVVILFKLGRRLSRLGRIRGGCFVPFASCAETLHGGLHGLYGCLKTPWDACWNRIDPDEEAAKRKKTITIKIISWSLMLIFIVLCLVFFVIIKDTRNLISLSGMALLLIISVAISWHPARINWRPVYVGLFVQLVFAVLTLQTRPGFIAFQFLGDRMAEFLENSKAGSNFVFAGYSCFAFDVLPVVVFFSSFISVLFHLGIISILIDKPSIVAKRIMQTTGPETLNAVANIFVSMTESPLITRPYMHLMTSSELHAIIVNGFASVAGSVLAAYISFGVPANHLLIACVMSAPAALAISKIIYPETCHAPLATLSSMDSIKSPYSNVLEAAMVGAMESAPIVSGIATNLIAFLSIYNFFNRTLIWLGERACLIQNLTFELIFSYVLWPIAFTMGVPQEDCFKVAELIGVKAMLNEFVAFEKLGVLISNSLIFTERNLREPVVIEPNGDWTIVLTNGTQMTLKYGAFYTNRAEVISTYALCGFANVGSIGIMLGAMVTLLPHRRQELSRMVLGGMIGGTIACFLTGCFAGLFYEEN